MKKIRLIIVLQLIATLSFAQFNISGTVKNSDGKILESASVFLENSEKGSSSDKNGTYIISDLKSGKYIIYASYVGYQHYSSEIEITKNTTFDIILLSENITTDDIIISATRVSDKTPIAHTNISEQEIENQNLGQDIPYLLNLTPSVVTSSDAGAGIGYTSISIRGTDSKRINITLDGIPFNDSESHSVYWVNMPDLASSIQNIQVQRGVGTSTNGAAAFGATIDFQSQTHSKKPYAKTDFSYGSFNSLRNNVEVGTGLINNKFSVETRISQISSDGFIDRANSKLSSFSVSGSYIGEKTLIKASFYSGKEKTYQAWNGVPKARLNNDEEGMQLYIDHWHYDQQEYDNMLNSDNRTYNFYTYNNETDNYEQSHFHFLIDRKITDNWKTNIALHYTKGEGYYENYKNDRDFADYQLNDFIVGADTLTSTNLIQQKHLDNDFYGLTFSLKYKNKKTDFIFGGAASNYEGDHFGRIIWAQLASNSEIDYEWYFNKGEKLDANIFAKLNYKLLSNLHLFGDLQLRHINYSVEGIHDDLRNISMEKPYTFVNPKAGLFFEPTKHTELFASVAVANREPSRRNYVDNTGEQAPTSEQLIDYELGAKLKFKKARFETNFYLMNYTDQLVLTGKINNVGDAILTNVDKSYRAGIEFLAGWQVFKSLNWNANLTLSKNKIKNFTDYIDSWDTGIQEVENLGETDLAFSPNVIFSNSITFQAFTDFNISLISKYVGKQYIDNSSNNDRALDPYFINNLRLNYSVETKLFNKISFHLMINNLLDEEYETWAWVYRYIYDEQENAIDGYFPQAGRNYMAGISIEF